MSMANSIHHEQGGNAAADVCMINTSLYHFSFILNVELSAFTDTIVWVAWAGQPIVYKPDVEFPLTLLHCGQIVQDAVAEIAKHYFLSNPNPFKFDPGGVLAIHLEAGVPSQECVTQLAALALHHLCTGLKVIAQLQSVDNNELVAYTMSSRAQGLVTHTNQSMTPMALQPEFHDYQLEESSCAPAILPMTSFLAWHGQCDQPPMKIHEGPPWMVAPWMMGNPMMEEGDPPGEIHPTPEDQGVGTPIEGCWVEDTLVGEAHLGMALQLEWLNYPSHLMVPMPTTRLSSSSNSSPVIYLNMMDLTMPLLPGWKN
ncbi:hypothetical protein BS47DRAFT_1365509 [Hydnum rufescens UP504]|uniref:Uncharacterized protein n=1 Tax=Hydnum rufescens UP504 TaxID=1448309 RepID=A0A9P6ANM7_9AGAM|nr:hypothetical protein BS47DRAFT_1365509 [Hydnum rufescens UP504]